MKAKSIAADHHGSPKHNYYKRRTLISWVVDLMYRYFQAFLFFRMMYDKHNRRMTETTARLTREYEEHKQLLAKMTPQEYLDRVKESGEEIRKKRRQQSSIFSLEKFEKEKPKTFVADTK